MTSPDPDPILEELRRLPSAVPPPDLDARVLDSARRVFERRRTGPTGWGPPFLERVVVPILLAGTACAYLAFALRAANALYR